MIYGTGRTISGYVYFIVTDPSPREIFAADFRDRIVHHLLCDEISPIFEADFISRSYANRVGKGTHAAIRRLRRDIADLRRRGDGGWYLKLDIRSFIVIPMTLNPCSSSKAAATEESTPPLIPTTTVGRSFRSMEERYERISGEENHRIGKENNCFHRNECLK